MEEILKQTSIMAKGVVVSLRSSEKKPGAYADLLILGQRNFLNVYLKPETAAKAKPGQLLTFFMTIGMYNGRVFFSEA